MSERSPDNPATAGSPPPDWWRAFFTESFGPLQRSGLRDDQTTTEVDFLERALALRSASTVLDVPCGTGRHAVELAARGHAVTGVDFNPEVLAAARSLAAERGVAVDLRRGDLRHLDASGAYDAAYCFWGSFGYFDADGDRRFVDGVHRALRSGGRFLIDTHVAESLLPKFRPRDWSWLGEGAQRVRVLEERRWNLETGRVDSTWTFIGEGAPVQHEVSIRVYAFRELRDLLSDAGFRHFTALVTGTDATFAVGSDRLSLVATR